MSMNYEHRPTPISRDPNAAIAMLEVRIEQIKMAMDEREATIRIDRERIESAEAAQARSRVELSQFQAAIEALRKYP